MCLFQPTRHTYNIHSSFIEVVGSLAEAFRLGEQWAHPSDEILESNSGGKWDRRRVCMWESGHEWRRGSAQQTTINGRWDNMKNREHRPTQSRNAKDARSFPNNGSGNDVAGANEKTKAKRTHTRARKWARLYRRLSMEQRVYGVCMELPID